MNVMSLIGAVIAAGMVVVSEVIVFHGNEDGVRAFEEPGVMAFNAIWAAAPFLLFAIIKKRTRKRAIWTGLAMTFAGWTWLTWDGWSYIHYEKVGGANIGLGMIMLIWPILVFAFMMIMTIRHKWDRSHEGHLEDGRH